MRAALLAIFLMTGSLLGNHDKLISCELVPIQRFRNGNIYHLYVTNVSDKDVSLCCAERYFRSGNTSPAFYAAITGKDDVKTVIGEDAIREAIQAPTGNENYLCTIAPGKGVWCGPPTIHTKVKQASFHFLLRQNGTSVPIQFDWRDKQSPLLTWKHVVGYRIPDGDASRIRLYEAHYPTFSDHKPDLPTIERSPGIQDLKPWCVENGLTDHEIDFAFYDRRSGFCLISTSEANHRKLKELRFE